MSSKTLGRICLAISGFSMVYMFLITYEGTYWGWAIFFVFLAFSILFHALDEKEKEIAVLRSIKEKDKSSSQLDEELVKQELELMKQEEGYFESPKDDSMQAIFFRKPPKSPKQ